MAKKKGKRHAKARKKRRQTCHPRPRKPPLHEELERRLMEEGPEAFFISLLTQSAALRREPEFRDLHFDRDLVAEALDEAFKRYRERLERAEREGEEAVADVWAEMEGEVIEALATPAFRRDFLGRLDRLIERLRRTGQREKFASALFIRPLLEVERFPWSICGLVNVIYREAQEQVFREVMEKKALADILLEGVDVEDFDALSAILEEPERKAAVEEFLKTHPHLKKRLQEEVDRQIEEAVEAIREGKIVLGLFRDEELLRAIAYLAVHLEEQGITPQTSADMDREAIAARYFEFVQRSIAEIATPARMAEMKAHLEGILRERWRTRDKQAPLIHAAMVSLDAWERCEDNPIFLAEYIRQSEELFKGPKAADPALNAKFRELVEEIKAEGSTVV